MGAWIALDRATMDNGCLWVLRGYRRSYVNHYMSAESPLRWSGGNADNLRDDYRDIIMVAGSDPWAHLGLADLSVPFYCAREHVA